MPQAEYAKQTISLADHKLTSQCNYEHVTKVENPSFIKLKRAIADIKLKIVELEDEADEDSNDSFVLFVYYAGHGFIDNGQTNIVLGSAEVKKFNRTFPLE